MLSSDIKRTVMWGRTNPVPVAPEVTVGTHCIDTMGEAAFSSAKERTQSYLNEGKKYLLQEVFKQRLRDHLVRT